MIHGAASWSASGSASSLRQIAFTVSPLEVEPPNQALLVGHAVGTQNYVCQPVNSLGRVGWVLFTPQATLFDERRELEARDGVSRPRTTGIPGTVNAR